MTTVVIQLETYSVPDCSSTGTRSFPGFDIFIKCTLLLFSTEAKNTSDCSKGSVGASSLFSGRPGPGRTNRLMGFPINLGSTLFPRKTAPDTNITVKIKMEFWSKRTIMGAYIPNFIYCRSPFTSPYQASPCRNPLCIFRPPCLCRCCSFAQNAFLLLLL